VAVSSAFATSFGSVESVSLLTTGRYASLLPPTARTTCPFITSRTGMIRGDFRSPAIAGRTGESGLDVPTARLILLASGLLAPVDGHVLAPGLTAQETVLGANLYSHGGSASIMQNHSVIGAES